MTHLSLRLQNILITCVLGCIVSSPNSYIKTLRFKNLSQKVTDFGDRTFKEVIKFKMRFLRWPYSYVMVFSLKNGTRNLKRAVPWVVAESIALWILEVPGSHSSYQKLINFSSNCSATIRSALGIISTWTWYTWNFFHAGGRKLGGRSHGRNLPSHRQYSPLHSVS